MAAGKLGAKVRELIRVSCAPSDVHNDAQSEWVAASAGEMFTEEIGGSIDVAGDRGVDHLNMMAFPARLPAPHGHRGGFGECIEIGDGEPEARIGCDRVPERLYGGGRVYGLLRLAIEGGSLKVGRDHPTVVLDRTTSRGRLDAAGGWPFSVVMHDDQAALVA
jgi:hypothetical protein